MWVARNRGVPTLNNHSGLYPPDVGHMADTCAEMPERILACMDFTGDTSITTYQDLMQRVMPIGFDDCDPEWRNCPPLF